MTPPKKPAAITKPTRKAKTPKPRIDKHVVLEDIPKYFILGGLLVFVATTIWIMYPFIIAAMIGAVFAVGFYPIHKKIRRNIPHRTLSAIISFFLFLLIIGLPIGWFITYLTGEAIETYNFVEARVGELLELDIRIIPNIIAQSPIGPYIERAMEYFPLEAQDVVSEVAGFATNAIQNTSEFLVNQTTNVAKQLSVFMIHLFVFFISIFFFIRDGDRVKKEFKALIPLEKKYREELVQKLHQMSRGILYGIFGAAILQGALGGVGFAIAGIENAVFWGTIMVFASIIPYIGSTIIWVPAAITLLITGHWVAAFFLTLWGLFIVGTVDNLVKPILIGESAQIHPLLSFLTIIGGVFTMGIPGIIIAPYFLSLALTFLHIYKLEYQGYFRQLN